MRQIHRDKNSQFFYFLGKKDQVRNIAGVITRDFPHVKCELDDQTEGKKARLVTDLLTDDEFKKAYAGCTDVLAVRWEGKRKDVYYWTEWREPDVMHAQLGFEAEKLDEGVILNIPYGGGIYEYTLKSRLAPILGISIQNRTLAIGTRVARGTVFFDLLPQTNAEEILISMKERELPFLELAAAVGAGTTGKKRVSIINDVRSQAGDGEWATGITYREEILDYDAFDEAAAEVPDASKLLEGGIYRVRVVSADLLLKELTVTEEIWAETGYLAAKKLKTKLLSKEPIHGLEDAGVTRFDITARGKNAVLAYCMSGEKRIEAPDKDPKSGAPVTAVGSDCFCQCENAEEIALPTGITSFGQKCFEGPKKLKKLTFGGKNTDIVLIDKGKLTAYATGKDTVTVPEGVTEIGKEAFTACPRLKKLIIARDVKLDAKSLISRPTLKTVEFGEAVTAVEVQALKNAELKEVVIGGEKVKMADPYLFDCIVSENGRLVFSYKKAAEEIERAKKDSVQFKIACDLLTGHGAELGEAAANALEFAVKYCIAKQDVKTLQKLLELELDAALDYTRLIDLTRSFGNAELTALLLEHSNCAPKRHTIREEKPAEPGPTLYIKARFPNGKNYSYFCPFKVKPGDRVLVPGSQAGQDGEVAEIIDEWPSARQAAFLLSVIQAFNVTVTEFDSSDDDDTPPELML